MSSGQRFFAIAMAVCAGLAGAGVARGQKLQIPPHERIVLKNGMTVLLMEKHGVPIINVAGIVKAGGLEDPAGEEGLASTTANLLRKGTTTRTAQQFAADIDFIGGSFAADASADDTSVSAEFLTKDMDKGLALLADAMLRPIFPQAEVDKLLAQSVDGIKAAKDSAQNVMFEYYQGYLYNGKGYGRPTGGDEVSLKNIKRAEIKKFYETYYTPANTILAVAGDFKAAEMKEKLRAAFEGWPAKAAPAAKQGSVAQLKGQRLLVVDKPDATQTFFTIGNVGIAANDPDRVAIHLVNTVFGGRFTSMLNEALRVESGLTYGASSFFVREKEPGPFAIFSYTKNETTGQAIGMALEVLRKLHTDGVTKEQLDSARNYIKGQFPPTIETSGQLAGLIASHEFHGLDDSEINELDARLDAVTPEIAKQVIAKHFPKDNLVFTLIGKAEEVGPAVKKFAEKEDGRKISEPGFWPGPQIKK